MRLGTTIIRSLVIILRIDRLGLPKGCANILLKRRKSSRRQPIALKWTLAALGAFGEVNLRFAGMQGQGALTVIASDSEAIQRAAEKDLNWIASSLTLLAMTGR
jgi:hypothetical protein